MCSGVIYRIVFWGGKKVCYAERTNGEGLGVAYSVGVWGVEKDCVPVFLVDNFSYGHS